MKKNLILLSCLMTLVMTMPAKSVGIKNAANVSIGTHPLNYLGFFKPLKSNYPTPFKYTLTGYDIYYTITDLSAGFYSITLHFIGLNGTTPVAASAPTAITVNMHLIANGVNMYPTVVLPVGFTSDSQTLSGLSAPPTLSILSISPTSYGGLPIYHVQP